MDLGINLTYRNTFKIVFFVFSLIVYAFCFDLRFVPKHYSLKIHVYAIYVLISVCII